MRSPGLLQLAATGHQRQTQGTHIARELGRVAGSGGHSSCWDGPLHLHAEVPGCTGAVPQALSCVHEHVSMSYVSMCVCALQCGKAVAVVVL